MPLIATRGAASAQGFGEFAQSAAVNYIEDVFSTYLYTGNGSTQTINNGIDLSGKGGLVWLKGRSVGYNNGLFDTIRGADYLLCSNNTDPSTSVSGIPANPWITGFNANGFGIGANGSANNNGTTYVSWTFREQPKFFDVVTYTGNGSGPSSVSHSLGSVPGCLIIKNTSRTGIWYVASRLSNGNYALFSSTTSGLQSTNAADNTAATPVSAGALTSTTFDPSWFNPNGTANAANNICNNGDTYVAYLFAHNAGGFGLTGTDNVISCGSFTTNGSGDATVTLGYEPQWVLYKRSSSTGSWVIIDNMRGDSANATNNANYLLANTSDAEATATWFYPTATGFTGNANGIASTDFIYIAIRRGPMKTPTTGTSVFSPQLATSNLPVYNTGFPVDAALNLYRVGGGGYPQMVSRLLGTIRIATSSTAAEVTDTNITFDFQNGWWKEPSLNSNWASNSFRRAPGFFDVVCYTGTGVARTVTHNLGVVPEMMIVKRRSTADNWFVYSQTLGNLKHIALDGSSGASGNNNDYWNSTSPTSTVFTVGIDSAVNFNGSTYVNYLFASVAGVSKVGSYTGTGTTKQIDCGFTGGARFVLIKRTDSTGDWYVWDSARGIVSGNDPYLLLNSTAAEVTNTDYVDTFSAGFEISSTAPAAINANGGTFIFLAIA